MPVRVTVVTRESARCRAPSALEEGAGSLERAGFVVTAVADGREALELLSRRRFDVVVLDILLPGIDGLEVCRELRRHSQMPVVILTAQGRTQTSSPASSSEPTTMSPSRSKASS